MRIALILAGLMLSLAAEPQEIYRWVDKDGVVHYADQPGAADAKRVEILAPNSYEATPPEAGDYSAPSQGPALIPYNSLTITQPTQDEVFFGADATVTASAEVGGSLDPSHALVFYLDGSQMPSTGSGQVQLSNLDRGTHFLRASVLDENGSTLISSDQISFHVRTPSINSPQSPQAPKPPKPLTPPKPAPKAGG